MRGSDNIVNYGSDKRIWQSGSDKRTNADKNCSSIHDGRPPWYPADSDSADCLQRKHSWPSFFVKFLSFVWWQCSLDFIVHTASNYGLTFVQLRVLSKGNIYTDYQDRWQLLSTIMIITANGHCQPRAFPGLTSAWSLNHSCHWSNTTTLVSSCPLRWKTQTLRLRINNIFSLKFDSNVFCELIYCLFVLTLFPQW